MIRNRRWRVRRRTVAGGGIEESGWYDVRYRRSNAGCVGVQSWTDCFHAGTRVDFACAVHQSCSVDAVFMYVCVAPLHFGACYIRLFFWRMLCPCVIYDFIPMFTCLTLFYVSPISYAFLFAGWRNFPRLSERYMLVDAQIRNKTKWLLVCNIWRNIHEPIMPNLYLPELKRWIG